jgi:oligopeptide transport system substrate-binding protein
MSRSTARVLPAAVAAFLLVGAGPVAALAANAHRAQAARAITAEISSDPTSLDPAVGFDPFSWSFIHATFVSLLTFSDKNLKIVPWGAAAMPTVSDGGRVYTFHLRPGLRFSDGEPVTASDYALAIDRILTPSTKSLVMAFYDVIQGASAYSSGKAKTVSGMKVLGPYTLQFTLVRPDRTFLDVMAIPNTAAVPPKALAKNPHTFGLHPVGDGPYVVQSYVPGREITLAKNPSYFDARSVPTPAIDVTIGLTPTTEALRVEEGTTDVMMDTLPTSVYLGVYNNPRYKAYLRHFSAITDNYVALNMRKAPFTNKLVREAAAYAVDRAQVLRAISGLGTILTQIEAPGMPGFDPSVKPLPYDPGKARKLLAEAGYPGGKGLPTITFADASGGFTAGPNVAQVVQQDLEQVGFKVQIKVMSAGAFLSAVGQYPMTMGIYGMDYPDPYDLIASQFECSEIAAGNNWQYYCNPAVDRALEASLSLPLSKAIPVYRRLQSEILASYPWIPLYYTNYWFLVNPAVRDFGSNPVFPMLFASWRLGG